MGGRDPLGAPASARRQCAGEPVRSAGADEKRELKLRRLIAPSALSFFAGAAWGLHETLVHHNARFFRVFPGASQRYWGPRSWENKYRDEWWVPVQVSDGKHLSATLHHVALFAAGVTITLGEKRPAWQYAVEAGVSLAAYSVGNAVVYDWIFRQ